eukprot:6176100-Pleurochrysis_carterae.AAC.1
MVANLVVQTRTYYGRFCCGVHPPRPAKRSAPKCGACLARGGEATRPTPPPLPLLPPLLPPPPPPPPPLPLPLPRRCDRDCAARLCRAAEGGHTTGSRECAALRPGAI